MIYFSGDLDKSEQNTQYEKTLQKGISLLKNNPNTITDIIQVATRLSYLRGRIFEQNNHQEKHDKSVEPKGSPIVKAEASTANNAGDGGSLGENPQDDPGKASGADNGDTGNSTFPADSKYNEQWDSHYDEAEDVWLEPQCQYEDCEYCNDRPTKPSKCRKYFGGEEMKRQGMKVTIGQLRRIADELEKELKETYKKANYSYPTFAATHQQIHQVNIINPDRNCSDTWEFEE